MPREPDGQTPELDSADADVESGIGGLSEADARRRLELHGPNQLVPPRPGTGPLRLVLRTLADPMSLLLLVAGATYFSLGDRLDAIVVLAALVPIALATVVLEVRGEHALEALAQLTAPSATVVRDGRRRVVSAETLVPGDVIVVREGDVVPADGTVEHGGPLMVSEASLTGESLPVMKEASAAGEAGLVFAGTAVLSGRAHVRVTTTGGATRYGRIGTLVAGLKPQPTPLERLVRRLVLRLGAVALVLCIVVGGLELLRGSGWAAAIIAGVSLAIAAVPEEFPIVYTLYLTLGAWRLTRDKALVRRLAGVETLGATTVICADKTGTLTLGDLEVGGVESADGASPEDLIEAAVLASEPVPFDPLEQALVRYAEDAGVDVAGLHAHELLRDYPFDPTHKYMSHVWRAGGETRICAKGALEGILARARSDARTREHALAANDRFAARGMRVLGLAAGSLPDGAADRDADESALELLGVVAFTDPLRPGVAESLEECRRAGIRVVMITGDHPVTAHAVADGLGLPHSHDRLLATGEELDAADDETILELTRSVNLFARTRPEQKYGLVRALRTDGQVVAMTGDGINDAPALREADIGVALGETGTAVAREAATLVLLDDNFTTIVRAVRDGRRIFDNLSHAFAYVIAFHLPLLLAALVVPLVNAPLLLFPVHLILLELIMHPTASLVFEADPAAPDIMDRPPRPPGSGFLTGTRLLRPLAEGGLLALAVLAVYLWQLATATPVPQARAIAIAAMVLGQTLLVPLDRSPDAPIWRWSLRSTTTLRVALLATVALLLCALYVPPLTAVLHLAPLSAAQLGLAALVALAGTLLLEPLKLRRRAGHTARGAEPPEHA